MPDSATRRTFVSCGTADGTSSATRAAMRHLLDRIHALPQRVATKFAVALTGWALLALALAVGMLAVHEQREVVRAAALDVQSQGDALAPVLEEVWMREGEERAVQMLRAADVANGDVALRISTEARIEGSDDSLSARVPLRRVSGTQPPVLVLEKERPRLSGAVAGATKAFLLAAFPLSLFAMLTAFALGEWLVGGPLRRVVARARRIGEGDFDGFMTVRGSAEIANLKHAINGMCDGLRTEREKARAEEAARIEAETRLRHADRLTTVGTLAAGVAHELGTPLNVILVESRTVEKMSRTPERIEEGARLIRNQAGRMTAIVQQLLHFARRREPSRAVEDVRQVVLSSVVLVAALARTRGCTVEAVFPDGSMDVSADASGIQQILTNLFVNAFDAMPEGGEVVARVTSAARKVPNGQGERAFVCIEVEDRGPGIDEVTRRRVFEPFFTTKDVGSGTGLGLSVALGIAEDHGGTIEVREGASGGSIFALYLPRDAEHPAIGVPSRHRRLASTDASAGLHPTA